MHQPDNVETTSEGLYIQEDTGSHNAQSASFPDATNARVWRYALANGPPHGRCRGQPGGPGRPGAP